MCTRKIYEYKSVVTIGDTNCTQNMYFLNFFKLQGIVRELWVRDCVEGGLVDLSKGLLLITRDANCKFIKDFYLYNNIIVRLQMTKIENTNTELRFRFYNADTSDLHSEGYQTIVFADSTHKLIRIPENWKAAINTYSDFNN